MGCHPRVGNDGVSPKRR